MLNSQLAALRGSTSPMAFAPGAHDMAPGLTADEFFTDHRPAFTRDAQAAISFNQATAAYIEQRVFEVKYRNVQWNELIPINTSGDPYAESVIEYTSNATGAAKFMGAGSMDVPLVETERSQFRRAIHLAAVGYAYTLEELGQSNITGLNVLVSKASAAREAFEFFMEDLSFQGKSEVGFEGLFNSSKITPVNVDDSGTGSSRLFADKSPDQILIDLNSGLNTSFANSKGTELADTMLLPLTTMTRLASLPRSPDSDTTVLEYFRKNNIYTLSTGNDLMIRGHTDLEAAGVGATKRMVTYRRDPNVLEVNLPMPLQFLQPFPKSAMEVEVAGMFRTSGLVIRYPGAMSYRDGF